MPVISLNHVDFQYDNSQAEIFKNLHLNISTDWKTGLIGSNGRGKTTLLKLIHRELKPTAGAIDVPVQTVFFPHTPTDPRKPTFQIIKDSIAPFENWERRMERLLQDPSEKNLAEYGIIFEKFQENHGYEIDALICREIQKIGLNESLLERPFDSLSGGEQTRALIIGLFVNQQRLSLIDEPTNHLDQAAREQLAEYLSRQSGFILVSHDRHFLDCCVDHIVSLNKNDIRINKGDFSEWKYQFEIEEENERRRSQNLLSEIKQLKAAARKRRVWSGKKEKEKVGAYDKGWVGKRSAKIMQRALSAENRIQSNLDEKQKLLKNVEKDRILKIESLHDLKDELISIDQLTVRFNQTTVIEDLSISIKKGDRIAITGPNGCGKSTLLNAIFGAGEVPSGQVYEPSLLKISRAYQHPLWQSGQLRHHLQRHQIDETRFRQILGVLGIEGNIFENRLETFSMGQLKKVDLCRSLLTPAHLYIWDEPLNYVDLYSREQIESVLLESKPTLLFVEHDQRFVESVSTVSFSL